jgi:hypothetical protein
MTFFRSVNLGVGLSSFCRRAGSQIPVPYSGRNAGSFGGCPPDLSEPMLGVGAPGFRVDNHRSCALLERYGIDTKQFDVLGRHTTTWVTSEAWPGR